VIKFFAIDLKKQAKYTLGR